MTGIVFENSLDHDIQVTINGKVKANLDPGESIAFDVKEGQRIGYIKAGTSIQPLSLPAPTSRPAPHVASSALIAQTERPRSAMREASPMEQLNLDGTSVHVHPTMKAAAASISVAWYELAKHLQNHPDKPLKGYLWRRVKDAKTNGGSHTKEIQRRAGKPVLQRSKSGQALRLWDSQMEAAEALGISSSGISKVCNGTYPFAGGFRWEFAKTNP